MYGDWAAPIDQMPCIRRFWTSSHETFVASTYNGEELKDGFPIKNVGNDGTISHGARPESDEGVDMTEGWSGMTERFNLLRDAP